MAAARARPHLVDVAVALVAVEQVAHHPPPHLAVRHGVGELGGPSDAVVRDDLRAVLQREDRAAVEGVDEDALLARPRRPATQQEVAGQPDHVERHARALGDLVRVSLGVRVRVRVGIGVRARVRVRVLSKG